MKIVDVLVIGAGAAGLMCATQAALRGRRTLLLEKSAKPGRKILMSGGGRCNFTNLAISPEKYLSQNPHFVKSALARYTQWDFIDWVEQSDIAYHEKTQGQLFCDDKASVLLNALLRDAEKASVALWLKTEITTITPLLDSSGFLCDTSRGQIQCESLVVATGGLSIPSMGSSPFAYQLAESFNIPIIPTRAGLVPFTLDIADKEVIEPLSGISLLCRLSCESMSFTDDLLLTHRGVSGPAALQLSSYWHGGDTVSIDCFPNQSLIEIINDAKDNSPNQMLKSVLSTCLPIRLLEQRTPSPLLEKRLADVSHNDIDHLNTLWADWSFVPSGTEGYRTAEVTLGGVDTTALSSKTMAVNSMPNLYFVGEAVDVTGWLGGYNFQWAWASGWVAGQYC